MAKKKSVKEKLAAAFAPSDKYVVWVVLALAAVGVAAVYSAVTFLAETKAGDDTEWFLVQHLIRVGAALGAAALFSLIDYRFLVRLSKAGLIGAIGLLVAVQVVGHSTGGATRWLQIGPVGFQPSDIAKVMLLLYVAVLLVQKQNYIKSFGRAFTPVFFWVLITVALIGIDDLSTAALVLTSVMLMCFVARVSIVQLGGLTAVCGTLAVLLLLASPERAARLEAYVGMDIFPHTDTEEVFSDRGEGYQAQQARIAFAMGGLTGVGPGKSVQRDFLPAPYNDFIFAIIAEEYGIIGALALLVLFCVLLFRGFLRIARHAADPLGLILGVGLTSMLVLYAFVHAGVACGVFPVTGLPLPFVSYGGTSMVTTGIMIGILLNISRHAKKT